jgi:hypothetical protein
MADRDRQISGSSSPNQAPEDMHWGINYLREDLRDIRLDIREIRVEMQARFLEMQGQFGAMQKQSDSRFFWTLGFMATLFTVHAAFMAALIKL